MGLPAVQLPYTTHIKKKYLEPTRQKEHSRNTAIQSLLPSWQASAASLAPSFIINRPSLPRSESNESSNITYVTAAYRYNRSRHAMTHCCHLMFSARFTFLRRRIPPTPVLAADSAHNVFAQNLRVPNYYCAAPRIYNTGSRKTLRLLSSLCPKKHPTHEQSSLPLSSSCGAHAGESLMPSLRGYGERAGCP